MSRRSNAATDKAAQNAATIKTLLKLEGNKICADCKRNKHPRWASWNLGVFVCIRCSGIHRGMGTHISRVKSVDLDAWTDEQLASIVKWGNVRANKYWEGKLAEGHVPSENKMENFIRTKYESKRWVMDGGMPDPSTLDEADDRELSQHPTAGHGRGPSLGQQQGPASRQPLNHTTMHKPRPHPVDLFGDDPPQERQSRSVPPKQILGPSKPVRQDNALLDIFGSNSAVAAAVPDRPASAVSALSQGPSRGDLKNSILSLYSSTPKPQSTPQPPQSRGGSDASQPPMQSNIMTFEDAFSGLSFGQTSAKPPAPPKQPSGAMPEFEAFTQPAKSTPLPTEITPAPQSMFPNEWSSPPPSSKPDPTPPKQVIANDDWGDFDSAPAPAPSSVIAPKQPPKQTSAMGELFDMASPSPLSPAIAALSAKSQASPKNMNPPPIDASVFQLPKNNITTPSSNPITKSSAPVAPASSGNYNAWAGAGTDNAWADNAWANPDPVPPSRKSTISSTNFSAPPAPTQKPASPVRASYNPGSSLARAPTNDDVFGGWGSNVASDPVGGGSSIAAAMRMPDSLGIDAVEKARGKPIVSQDEDFGGWASSSPVATKPAMGGLGESSSKPGGGHPAPAASGGFGGGDDLFSNVWG